MTTMSNISLGASKEIKNECFITTHFTDIAFQNLHVYDEKRKLVLLVLKNEHDNGMGNKI